MAWRVAWFLAAFLLLCGGLVLLPALDLGASALFYRPGAGFFLAGWMPFRLVRGAMPYAVAALIVGETALLAVVALRRRAWCGLDARAAIFLLAALALGPGLVVNTIFKDHWGRARPIQIAAFGGSQRFTPAFVPSDQCARNCSFPAGDPSVGFYLVAGGLLVAPRRRRVAALSGAIVLGGIIGIVRIAQGGHFLSDVMGSGFLVFAICWLLHRWIVVADGLATLLRQLRRPSPELRRLLGLALVSALTVAAAMLWLDRPLAPLLAVGDPGLRRVFGIVTMLGVSTGYLVAAALLALGFAAAARRAAEPERKRRLARAAWRAAFVFAAVAGAGLAGDILKPVFGRARPRLLLADGIYGFTWHGARAAYWSFPSGHAITIAALAAALTQIERRWLPLYGALALLVMASRLALAEHYLSDVLAGAFFGAAAAWWAGAGFRGAGIALALSDSP